MSRAAGPRVGDIPGHRGRGIREEERAPPRQPHHLTASNPEPIEQPRPYQCWQQQRPQSKYNSYLLLHCLCENGKSNISCVHQYMLLFSKRVPLCQ
jgi:hypothetical protein